MIESEEALRHAMGVRRANETRMLRRTSSFALLLAAATVGPAAAWGGVGHTTISRAGARAFPATLPAFVRSDAAVDEIASLGPELDRSKDAGATHDHDLDTGHYVDIGDDGKVFGVVDLSALPATREAYDTALRGANSDEYKAGYLPYALIDGWQQIAKDFAIWRIDDAALRSSSTQDRAWFTSDRALRETLTLRDIGIWSHYVGDASQPLHISVHFNGWGAYPNPNGYSQSHTLHADFETRFVDAHATLAAVTAAMAPARPSTAPIATLVGTYLAASASHVVPLYDLDKAGAFANGTPDAVAFVDARLADGAAELRDLVVDAWNASDSVKVGYPHAITPADVESGTVMPTRALAGAAD